MIVSLKNYFKKFSDQGVDLNSITRIFVIFTVISFLSFALITTLYLVGQFKTTLNDMLRNTREPELRTLGKNIEQYVLNRVQILKDIASKEDQDYHSVLILGEKIDLYEPTENTTGKFKNKNYNIELIPPNLIQVSVKTYRQNDKTKILAAKFPIEYENIFGNYNPSRTSYSLQGDNHIYQAENFENFEGTEYQTYLSKLGLILRHKVSEAYNKAKGKELLFNLFIAVLISSSLSSILIFFIGKNMLINPYIELNTNKKLLEQRTKELENSNEELDRFAYLVSHDLKEPIRGISIYADMVQRDSHSLSNDNKDKLNTISQLSKKSISMLAQILEHSRVGQVELAYREVDMQELIEEVVFSLKVFIEESNAQIIITRKLPPIFCDSSRSGEVFRNLIVNGIKYNDKQEKLININYSENPQTGLVEFSVSDNGNGIEPKYFKAIFEIFKRITNDNTGSGVGLALVKRIIEKHNGSINLESTQGEGSCFYFNFGERSIIKSEPTSVQ